MRRYNVRYQILLYSDCHLAFCDGRRWRDVKKYKSRSSANFQYGIARKTTALRTVRKLLAKLVEQGGRGEIILQKFARRHGKMIGINQWVWEV